MDLPEGPFANLPLALLSEVVLRLSPRGFVRCSCVSKHWYAAVQERSIMEEFNRRQKQRPMLILVCEAGFEDLELADFHLESFDLKTNELESICCFSGFLGADEVEIPFDVLGSCNGALLMSSRDNLYICNATTQRWAPLPPLHRNCNMVGLYHHKESDEYRVLCKKDDAELTSSYSVYHIGSGEERVISREKFSHHFLAAPVLIGPKLYWVPYPIAPSISAFDTVSESLESIPTPPYEESMKIHRLHILEVDGELALSVAWNEQTEVAVEGPKFVDLWTRPNGNWLFKLRVELPVGTIISNLDGVDEAYWNAFICNQDGNTLVDLSDSSIMHCDHDGRIIRVLKGSPNFLESSPFTLKANLDHHVTLCINIPRAQRPPFFRML